MEVQNKIKSKTFGVSAIMRNKKLSALVGEALNSPPGSTKRTTALSMIRSLNRTTDGMGGAMNLYDVYNPQGQMSSMYPMTYNPQGQMSYSSSNNQPNISVQSAQPTGNVSVQQPNQPGNVNVVQPNQTGNVSVISSSSGPSTILPAAPVAAGPMTMNTGAETSTTPAGPMSSVTPADLASLTSSIVGSTGDINAEPVPSTPMELGAAGVPVTEETETADFFDSWYANLSAEDKKTWQPLYEAVKGGVGAPTFAWKMLADKDKLKQLLPGVPVDMLPEGASLARQIGDLEEALKKEYEVDTLRSNVKRLEERGLTVEQDLTDYITSRDEYIAKLDTMIDGAKDSLLKMDMGNPFINQRMNKYLDYLYLMKGRQQKRYADYVADSIEQHNAKLTRAQNAYDSAYEKYEDKLKTKTDITTEDYTTMKTMLEDMYNNLDSREEEIYSTGILAENYAQAQLETAKMVLEAAEGTFQKVGPTAVDEATEFLTQNLGSDEPRPFVGTDKWIAKKREWDKKYGQGQFEKYFPPEEWLNPNDPTAEPYFVTPLQLFKGLDEGISNEDLI